MNICPWSATRGNAKEESQVEIKPYIVSTVVGGLACLGMGIEASMRAVSPVAKNNARVQALAQIVNHVYADTCYVVKTQDSPNIGTPIKLKGGGRLPTSCLYYPASNQYAYIGQLNYQLQVLYVFSQTEVNKAKSNG